MRSSHRVFVLMACVLSAVAGSAIAADADPAPAPIGDASQSQSQIKESAAETEVVTTTFTVDKVDPATRMVTLKGPDGSVQEIQCGPEVRNFEQIKPGDQVTAAVTEDIVMEVRSGSAAPSTSQTQVMDRTPQGAKPGAVLVQSEQMTAKVTDVDPDKRMISLQGPAGVDKTMKVRPAIDLTQIKKGDEVTVQFTRATAIIVGTPQESAQPAAATVPAKDR